MKREAALIMIAVLSAACSRAKDANEFATMQARGEHVMGVNQFTSAHVFEDLSDGGRVVLDRDDPSDSAGIATVRAHMRDIAAAFYFACDETLDTRRSKRLRASCPCLLSLRCDGILNRFACLLRAFDGLLAHSLRALSSLLADSLCAFGWESFVVELARSLRIEREIELVLTNSPRPANSPSRVTLNVIYPVAPFATVFPTV